MDAKGTLCLRIRLVLYHLWKYINFKYAFICTFVIFVPLYYFLSAGYTHYPRDHVNCTLLGDQNFVPEWIQTYKEKDLNGFLDAQNVLKKNATFVVPNIVHYIWYTKEPKPLKFHHMLSILSAHQNIKPDQILFHMNMEPIGEHWERVKDLPNLKLVHRQPSVCLFGDVLKLPYYETSSSNVDRLRVLYETGGIYLDLDVLVIKSFNDLRKYPCTIGLEDDNRACGGIAICAKESFFLTLWINSFLDDYQIKTWAYNTGKVPYNLWRRYPHLVHVEQTKLNRPNYKEINQIYGDEIIDWRENYSVHIWYRVWLKSKLFKEEPNMNNIKSWNSTFGQIARTILYGKADIMT